MTEPHAIPPAADTEGAADDHPHLLPVKTYLQVYGALLVLTYITVQVSLLDLGAVAIYVAMAVAVVKAALVVGYFMHLKFETGFNRLVFLGSLLFLVFFFVFTMFDLSTRGAVQAEQDTFFMRDERAPNSARP